MTCPTCHLSEPNNWCWEGHLTGCPFDRPPRHLDVVALWRLANEQEKRIAALENRA